MSCVASQYYRTLGSKVEAQHSGVLNRRNIWAFVTCEPRTPHQYLSAVFVPGPQAFVATASDARALAKNFNSTPGAAQCSTNTQTTACFGAETTSSLSSVSLQRSSPTPTQRFLGFDLAHAARRTSCCGQCHHQLASTQRRRELREPDFFRWRGRVAESATPSCRNILLSPQTWLVPLVHPVDCARQRDGTLSRVCGGVRERWKRASKLQSEMRSQCRFWTASTQFVQHLGLVSSPVPSVITLWINVRPAATDSELCPPRGCETTRPTKLASCQLRPWASRVCATSWSLSSRRC